MADQAMTSSNATRCTPEVIDALVELISTGVPLKLAAEGVGVAYPTYNRWMRQGRKGIEPYATLERRVREAKTAGIRSRVERITKAAKNGKWQADAWYLERVYPEEFALKTRLEATVTPGERHVDLSQMNDDELAALEKALGTEQLARTEDEVELLPPVSTANGDDA